MALDREIPHAHQSHDSPTTASTSSAECPPEWLRAGTGDSRHRGRDWNTSRDERLYSDSPPAEGGGRSRSASRVAQLWIWDYISSTYNFDMEW
jgi:hypothetical protein